MYLVFSLFIFFTWVNPSLVGQTQSHIAADSGTYMYFAESLREGLNDPFVLGSLASFPNTLWVPVLLGLAFKSTFTILLFDYAVLIFSVWLIQKAAHLDVALFLLLLLANVTTSISLISLNKEIIDLLVTALFIDYLGRKKRIALAAALLIGLVNRYETAVVMLLYLLLLSRWNPLRSYRKTTLVVTAVLLSLFLSGLLSKAMSLRLDEALSTATSGGLLLTLDNLQMHYLFFVAMIPKVLDNLFSELINISHWPSYSLDEAANTFFLLGNNLANLLVLSVLLLRGRFKLRNNLVFYACLSAMFMSTALIIQPRYFYGAYVVLCVECARRLPRASSVPVGVACVAS
jgi:hypothetical protein